MRRAFRIWLAGAITAAFAIALFATAPAAAQTTGEAEAPSAKSEAPPYDPQLLRLSEILGAVHYLTTLCKSDGEQVWREEMSKLIEAEAPDAERKRLIVDAFNRGYHGFSNVYTRCTPSAELAIQRYLREGAAIARDVVNRYGR
ncbi:uncharacterized protein (TIGR02301 family) [Rhodobium orientis]|uniref:TIGR02301 family protein n=1 Tax=Rhodobium orientis TaxID=34017 RepID=UPI0014753F39|nr:TIGR02301 family protein [Rhodobium orientis]MBB4303925.1 uncharacterized protein (TIGR02301 family) [Rhodobium orientis]